MLKLRFLQSIVRTERVWSTLLGKLKLSVVSQVISHTRTRKDRSQQAEGIAKKCHGNVEKHKAFGKPWIVWNCWRVGCTEGQEKIYQEKKLIEVKQTKS